MNQVLRDTFFKVRTHPFYEIIFSTPNYNVPTVERLNKDSLVIDCGANVGDIASILAQTKSQVICFEPNPLCVEVLEKRFKWRSNVRIINKAVSNQKGSMKLFCHKTLAGIAGSASSSLEEGKSNIDHSNYFDVEVVKLSQFINDLEKPVNLLKIDIECHEDIVLNDLIDQNCFSKIDFALVETHDKKYPFMLPRIKALKEKIQANGLAGKVDLTWH